MPTLSDEEFLAQAPEIEKQLESQLKASETTPPPAPATETPPAAETPPADSNVQQPPVETSSVEQTPSSPDEPAAKPVEGDTQAAAAGEAEGGEAAVEPDYKAIYERLFGQPIRAAGQDIKLNNPEEAISLIQKGVGFHSKLNRIHNELKYVEMLRNNGLLDEEKLSHLIDVQAGKPGAIKKLLDSVKVDPLTLDSAEASTYAPSDHRVTDEQVVFQSTVADLSASDAGRKVLSDAQAWDQATKAEIYRTPAVLQVLTEQKEMGRYDLIVAELNRAKLLGQLPPGETFLQSYTRVGQQMMQAGRFGPVPGAAATPTPVAQKTVTPQPPANSKKAAAAAPTKASAPGAKPQVNIDEMDDATFEAHFRKTFRM
jgi:propanediol dehydratase small subunit